MSTIPEEILDGRAKDVVAQVAATPMSATEARALHAEEVASGRGADKTGRITVKNALEEKCGEAGLDDASPGLARAPASPSDTPPSRPPQAAASSSRAPWEKREWCGHDLYVCRTCGRDSFDVGEIYEHVKRKHWQHPGQLTPENL